MKIFKFTAILLVGLQAHLLMSSSIRSDETVQYPKINRDYFFDKLHDPDLNFYAPANRDEYNQLIETARKNRWASSYRNTFYAESIQPTLLENALRSSSLINPELVENRVKFFLAAGDDPRAHNSLALFYAVIFPNKNIIKMLIDAGADVKAQYENSSVLHHIGPLDPGSFCWHAPYRAFYEDYLEAIQLLVAAGADLDAIGKGARSARTRLQELRFWSNSAALKTYLDSIKNPPTT